MRWDKQALRLSTRKLDRREEHGKPVISGSDTGLD